MREALAQAALAEEAGEVPVGAVVVLDGQIIARGFNQPITAHDPTAHAEIVALRNAARFCGNYRLPDCELYVTLEPCPMCAGAIVQARIPKVVIGSMNPKAGCAGSVLNLLDMPGFNHRVEVERGILEEPCSRLMSGFFKELRLKRKKST